MALLAKNFFTAIAAAFVPAWNALWTGLLDIGRNIFAALGLGG